MVEYENIRADQTKKWDMTTMSVWLAKEEDIRYFIDSAPAAFFRPRLAELMTNCPKIPKG